MKLIHIVPVQDLYRTKGQEMHMFLTHLVERYPEYVDFAKNEKGYKILDNSLIELGDAVSMQRVIKAAEQINADEIVLPDKFLNRPETLIRVITALDELYKYESKGGKKFKKMAVVHGENEEEWLRCFNALNNMKGIDVLGIPKVTHKLHPKGRAYFVNRILNKSNKEIHLLGVWENMEELEYMRYPNTEIRSVDTSLPALNIILQRGMFDNRKDEDKIDLENNKMPMHYVVDDFSTDDALERVSNYVSSL